jgi:Co/Zn/Cd efflux system component
MTQSGHARFRIAQRTFPFPGPQFLVLMRPSKRSDLRKSTVAHHQKAVAAAVAVNSAIFVVEAIAGYQANSLSLIMDSIHNLSDELALIFIYLAFVLSQGVSRRLLRSANIFNSVGLILVSAVLIWQSVERLSQPMPVQGIIAIAVGIAAAAANWSVARLLLNPGRNNAAIRLAYIHNMGDVCIPRASGGRAVGHRYRICDLRHDDRCSHSRLVHRVDGERSSPIA